MPGRLITLLSTGALGAIGNAVQAGIVVVDPAARLAHANAFFCSMVAYPAEELRGQTMRFPC